LQHYPEESRHRCEDYGNQSRAKTHSVAKACNSRVAHRGPPPNSVALAGSLSQKNGADKNARAKADAAGARLRAVVDGDPSCTVTKRLLLLEADSRCRPKAMRARRPMCQLTPILVRRFASAKKRRRARNCATPLQCLATRRGCNRIWIRVSAMLPPAMSPGDLLRRRHLSVELEGMKFQEIAPFLRAADSSQDRRRMSREFDARITAFLRLGDDPALPRIQCWKGVPSRLATSRRKKLPGTRIRGF
jgi:hypothetical protein